MYGNLMNDDYSRYAYRNPQIYEIKNIDPKIDAYCKSEGLDTAYFLATKAAQNTGAGRNRRLPRAVRRLKWMLSFGLVILFAVFTA